MGVEKNVLKPGDGKTEITSKNYLKFNYILNLGINQPKKGQKVSVHYTGLFSVDIFI
jgi:FKBP-type peptidyl-prolyl cis-trans isomerase